MTTKACFAGAAIVLFFVGTKQAAQPSPTARFDLKEYGFAVERGIKDDTAIGFLNEQQIAVRIYQCLSSPKCSTKLLVLTLGNRTIKEVNGNFDGKVSFLADGRILFVRPTEITIYTGASQRLSSRSVLIDPGTLEMKGVFVSPDGLRFSIPTGQGASILNVPALETIAETTHSVVALGNAQWFVRQDSVDVFTEQTARTPKIKGMLRIGVPGCPTLPDFLNSTLILLRDCSGKTNVVDTTGSRRYKLGKALGDFGVRSSFSGRRFATELYEEKNEWSGAAQYSKRILKVLDAEHGSELFRMEDIPSENEPSSRHYFALSPSAVKLAAIRNGKVDVFELAP